MAQDVLSEALNAFKRSLEETSGELKVAINDIRQSSKSAIKNIEKETIEQAKKQDNNTSETSSSSSSTKEYDERKSLNIGITYPPEARALAEQHAPKFYDRKGFEGLSHEEVVDKVTEIILKSGKAKKRNEIAIGIGKEPRSWEKGDRDYHNMYNGKRKKAIRLFGPEEGEKVLAQYSKMDVDKNDNLQFQHDFTGLENAFAEREYELKQQKEVEIQRDKKERKQKELLKELRAEFKDAEREIQSEERQQVVALKERQQLQTGVAGDLIQGGAGMAMGVALNKPTIIFASLATSAAKVTSRFGMLGKAIAGVIAVLSAVGAVVNVLSGKTSDNVLKGSVKDIRPEYSGALKAVGASYLGDENALLQDAGNITDLKANISNEVGFSQTLASLTSSPLGATLAKKGMNPLGILQKVNGMTTEDAHDYLMGIMESFSNSNDRRLFAKYFGLENSLNLHHQRMLNGSGETGRDAIREAKERVGEIPNEVKAGIDKSQKKATLARAALENNPESTKFITKTVELIAGAVNVVIGDNNKKDKIMLEEYESGYSSNGALTHLINEGKMPDEIDYNHLKSLKITGYGNTSKRERKALKGFLERDKGFGELGGKELEKAQANNVQQLINELQTVYMNNKNTNSVRNNGVNVINNANNPNTTSVNLVVTDKTQNGIRAHHAGGN